MRTDDGFLRHALQRHPGKQRSLLNARLLIKRGERLLAVVRRSHISELQIVQARLTRGGAVSVIGICDTVQGGGTPQFVLVEIFRFDVNRMSFLSFESLVNPDLFRIAMRYLQVSRIGLGLKCFIKVGWCLGAICWRRRFIRYNLEMHFLVTKNLKRSHCHTFDWYCSLTSIPGIWKMVKSIRFPCGILLNFEELLCEVNFSLFLLVASGLDEDGNSNRPAEQLRSFLMRFL